MAAWPLTTPCHPGVRTSSRQGAPLATEKVMSMRILLTGD